MATYIISPEQPNGARAVYDRFQPAQMFNGLNIWNVQTVTSSQVIIVTASGDRLILKGSGFSFDRNMSDPWISGTITNIELWNYNLTAEYASITGLNTSLADFGHALPGGEKALAKLLFSGNDTLIGGDGHDVNFGAMEGNDSIFGGNGDDDILPGAGNDTIDGGAGFNGIGYGDYSPEPSRTTGITINLGAGFAIDPWGHKDEFKNIQSAYGTELKDTLIGTEAGNWLSGGGGDDSLFGNGGDDTLEPGTGSDIVSGGSGVDVVTYEKNGQGIKVNLQTGTVEKASGSIDTISEVETVRATGFADSIVGSAANERFQLLGGNDTLDGGGGQDTVHYDRDYRTGGTNGVTVNLATGRATDGFGGTDVILNVENVSGTQYSDRITGNDFANLIIGRAGDDNLIGGAGDDTLEGGDGSDVLKGGTGVDTAVFTSGRSAYSFSLAADGALIIGGSETDLAYDVELFSFSDGTFTSSELLNNSSSSVDIFRFYNNKTGTHFYTASAEERDVVIKTLPQYLYEGNAFDAGSVDAGDMDVFRFYNSKTGAHFYTANTVERDMVLKTLPEYVYEGPAYGAYANDGGGSHTALYRFYNIQTNTHFYTTNVTERDTVIATLPQYHYEGIAYYVDFA
jgi:Ca2+-binding RTX toxin-like protein